MIDRPQAFRTHYEDGCSPGFGDTKDEAALMFNPKATPLALAAAAQARADCLRKSLDAWSTVTGSCVEVSEVAGALEPMAQEVQLLLAELIARLPKPGTAPA